MKDFPLRPHGYPPDRIEGMPGARSVTEADVHGRGAMSPPGDSAPPPPATDSAVSLPVSKFVAGLYRSRWWVAALTLVFGLGASVKALLAPTEYGSRGQLLLKGGAEDVAVTPGQAEVAHNSLGGNVPHILTSPE